MVFSRSSILLRLARCKTDEATNLISSNVSKNFRLFAHSTDDTIKNEVQKYTVEDCHLTKNATPNNTRHIERLTKDNANTESDNNNTNMHNELQMSHNVELLERNNYMFSDALEDIDIKLPGPLDRCTEDLSHIVPELGPTYNFAKYADRSNTIQQLVKLGVELYKLERDRDVIEMILSLDFDKHMKPYIQFLHDCGVSSENLGNFITKNPYIFKEDMDDLYTRIRYLKAHNYTSEMIQVILTRHPPWLSFNTREIDTRLGHFQVTFELSGHDVRCLTVRSPKLITYDMEHIKYSTFAVKEEMGFNTREMRLILLNAPHVWIRARSKVVETFDYLHNHMELPHKLISQQPKVLLCKRPRLEKRDQFLACLKRNQYDPRKPLYVSPLALVEGSDADFCINVAKASVSTYNEFLKSF